MDNLVALSALQKTLVDFLFEFAWEFCIETWLGFLDNLFWSPFPTNNWGNFGAKFGAGRKFKKFGELSFCNFSDLKLSGMFAVALR